MYSKKCLRPPIKYFRLSANSAPENTPVRCESIIPWKRQKKNHNSGHENRFTQAPTKKKIDSNRCETTLRAYQLSQINTHCLAIYFTRRVRIKFDMIFVFAACVVNSFERINKHSSKNRTLNKVQIKRQDKRQCYTNKQGVLYI